MTEEEAVLETPKKKKKKVKSSKEAFREIGLSPKPRKAGVKAKKSKESSSSDPLSPKPKKTSKKKESTEEDPETPKPKKKSSSKKTSDGTKTKKKKTSTSKKKTGEKKKKSRSTTRKNENEHQLAWVYKNDPAQLPQPDPVKIQGVWKRPDFAIVCSPQEVWVYEKSSKSKMPELKRSKNIIHGVWGYNPDTKKRLQDEAADGKERTLAGCDPTDFWFFTPNDDLPSYFTTEGFWTLPMITNVKDQIAPNSSGFVQLGKGHVHDALGVAGDWKMLYQRADPSKDKPVGPGMKGRVKKHKPMVIHVVYPNRKHFPLTEVTPKTTIHSVKQMISEHEEIPMAQEHLFFQGKELEDDTATLEKCGINDGDAIHLDGMKLNVIVQTPDGKEQKHVVGITPILQILRLKGRVEKRTGIPPDTQHLQFKEEPLNDDYATMDECGILHNDTVIVKTEAIIQTIKIRTPDRKEYVVPFESKETVRELKRKLERKTGVPVNEQRLEKEGRTLFEDEDTLKEQGISAGDVLDLKAGMALNVHTPDGKVEVLDFLKPSDTIEHIKERIEQRTNMPTKAQHLFFNNRELSDPKATLRECNLEHDDDIDLCEMRINIVMPDGLKIPIDCKPTDDVKRIKQKTEDKTKVPVAEQRLLFKGQVLENPFASLGDGCGIQHGDDINLEGMIVNVETPSGTTIAVACKPSDTIKVVKQKIQEQTNIPIDQQLLKSAEDKPYTKDKAKLEEAGIKHNDNLKLERMQVNVKTLDGTIVPVFCSPNDTVENIKKKIEKETDVPAKEQLLKTAKGKDLTDDSATLKKLGVANNDTLEMDQFSIMVKTPDGETVPVNCSPRDNIRDFKEKVEEETGIPAEGQILTKADGTDLDDDTSTLEAYGIQNKDAVSVDQMHIKAKTPDGEIIPVYCGLDDTIEEVKDIIEETTGIPAEEQTLVSAKDGKELTDPMATLKDCGIKHRDTLDVVRMQINVKCPDGNVVQLNVKPSDLIRTVKEKLEKETDTPVESDQKIKFKGLELGDPETLFDCGVNHGDTIDLRDPFCINVDTPSGESIPIGCKPTTDIKTIKAKVEQRTGIPVADQSLVFQGNKVLENDDTVEECGLQNDDTVDLLDKAGMQIVVYKHDGSKDIPLSVEPTTTISEVKEMVKHKAGIAVEDQRLHFNGKLLKAPKMTLKKAGIKNGDCLDLEGMIVNVKVPGRKILPFDVTPEDTIESIKRRLEQRVFVAVIHQRLIFNGEDMDNLTTLRQNNIKHGALLNLKGMTIYIQMPKDSKEGGEKFPIKVIPTWRLIDVKKEISHEKSPELKDVRWFKLWFGETELIDASKGGNRNGKALTIDDFGIKEGDTLLVEKIPLFDVQMGNWGNPLDSDFRTKDRIKREGRRGKHSSQGPKI